MTRRIFHSILTVSLAALLACLVLIVGVLHSYFEERVESELESQTAYIAQGVALNREDYLEGLKSSSRITWVDQDGTVLYDSQEPAASMENHAQRQEIRQAMETGKGYAARYSQTLAQKTIYFALRLEDGTVLRTSDTQYSVWVLVLQVVQPLAVVVLAAWVLAAVMASRVSRAIVEPINQIDLTSPGEGLSYDELTPLLAKIRSQNRQIQRQMAQLSRRQEEFTAITENMSEGFLIIDTKTHVLSYNAAALRLLHVGQEKLPGDVSIYTLNREAGFRRSVEEALAGRRSEQYLEKEDTCRQVIASPVFQEGHLNGAVLVILDVTEQEQREQLRREFTANVSHELKTPLTAISGTAEILENGLVKPGDVAHFAGNIHKEAGRLIELVNDIIQLSRLDEGGVSADWQTCGLLELSKRVAEQVRPAAEKKHLNLTVMGQEVQVRAVPQILEEIVYNLCDNAVKYNRENGSVAVTVEQDGSAAVLTVQDTGIGIAPEVQGRIFERFYRVDKSHPSGGTGLGLSIVKHGASYLGAQVDLHSETGKGSTFTVRFPIAEAAE